MDRKELIRKLAEGVLEELEWLSRSSEPVSVFVCYKDGEYYVRTHTPTGEALCEFTTLDYKEVMSEWDEETRLEKIMDDVDKAVAERERLARERKEAFPFKNLRR